VGIILDYFFGIAIAVFFSGCHGQFAEIIPMFIHVPNRSQSLMSLKTVQTLSAMLHSKDGMNIIAVHPAPSPAAPSPMAMQELGKPALADLKVPGMQGIAGDP
jgi:hypothetical protein